MSNKENSQIKSCEEIILHLQQNLKDAKKRSANFLEVDLIKTKINFWKMVIKKHYDEKM